MLGFIFIIFISTALDLKNVAGFLISDSVKHRMPDRPSSQASLIKPAINRLF